MASPTTGGTPKPPGRGLPIPLPLDVDVGVFAVVTGYLYLTGYFITAITLRNYGIHRFEAVKLQYVEAGVAFTVLAGALVVVPVVTAMTYYRVRSKSGLPHLWAGLIGYVINFSTLIMLLTFFSMFVTSYDWGRTTPLHQPLSRMFYVYASFSVFEVVALPVIERRILARTRSPKHWFNWLIEPLRYLIVLLSLAFVILLGATLPWLWTWLQQILPFTLCLLAIMAGGWSIRYWLAEVGAQDTRSVILILGGTGLMILFYVTINAYVFGVVRMLPMNRGGRLPLTYAHIVADDSVLKSLPLKRDSLTGAFRWGPVYIVEEGSDHLYISSVEGGDWTREWRPIIAIDKGTIKYMTSERIRDGAPRRVPRPEHQESQKQTPPLQRRATKQ